jgi:DNA-binding MarR family transcriptional regulator
MKPSGSTSRPIGYWLKRADELLTQRTAAAQQANGLVRTEWQILNLLHEWKSAPLARLEEEMSPFVDAGDLADQLQRLQDRRLIDTSASMNYRLASEGERLHAAALAQQKQVREQAMKGISPDDYQKAVSVLEKLVANLESQAKPS